MANKSNTRTQNFGDVPSSSKKEDENSGRSREAQNSGRAGNNNNEVERERDSRSRSSRSRSSRSRRRSRSPLNSDSKGGPDVCRDFLRGDCNRGQDCRYSHPNNDRADRRDRSDRGDRDPPRKRSWFTVCLDFQNGKCSRDDCRYFHVSDDDEDLFRETGEVSTHIINQAVCNSHLDIPSDRMRPACKDYLKGSCSLKNCRYRHVSREEYEDEIYASLQDALYEIMGPPRGSLGRNALPSHRMAPKIGLLGSGPFQPQDREEMDFGRPGSLLNEFRPEIFDRRDDDPRANMAMRENSGFPMRRSPGLRRSRDVDLNDFDSVRRECIRLQEDLYDITHEKDNIINDLEIKLGDFKRGGLDSDRYDDDSMLTKVNRELQLDIECLRRENDDLRNGRGRGSSYDDSRSEARIRIVELEDDNQMLMEKAEKLDTQIAFFKTEIQTWKNYELFVKEQISNLQSQFFNAERELSHSWGGGPPPLASQREAWSHVKSIVSLIANAVPQNLPPNKGKLDLDRKPSPPVRNSSPSLKMGSSPVPSNNLQNNMRPNVPGIRPSAPNSIRPNAPINIRPGAPNPMRPIAPSIRPGNQVRPGVPGSVRPIAPGAVRPGIQGMRPLAPGSVRPLGPGTVRPLAPGSVRPAGAGILRPTAPGALRLNAPNIRSSTPNETKPNAPNSIMSNAQNTIRPNAPGNVRPNQPGNLRAGPGNNIRPNQPGNIKPNSLLSNRPNIQTPTSTTDAETTTYSNAQGYNTGGYYTSANSNYQPEGSGNYSSYTSNASGTYNSEGGNYSTNTPGNFPSETSGSYTADTPSFSNSAPVTYPASATGTYSAGASTQYPTAAASSTYSADASGAYAAGASTTYSTGATGAYSAEGSSYPVADASGTYPTDGSYPTTDSSGNYMAAGSYPSSYPTGTYSADMYANYGTYADDGKKNVDFISQVYNQPPPPPPSQNSPTTKSGETTTNQYWRSGF